MYDIMAIYIMQYLLNMQQMRPKQHFWNKKSIYYEYNFQKIHRDENGEYLTIH